VAFDITKDVTVLGRDVSNDIVIGDSEISRQHARISRTPAGYVLEDLGSTNGTYVDGERLAAPRVLNPGDLIGLGENVSLTFSATSPEAAATVMGPAARAAAAPRAPYPPPPPGPATPAAIAQAPPEAPPKRSRLWLFAGCGCLVIVILAVLILAFLPCEWWLTLTNVFGMNLVCPG
jgi:predicted component of type VI protein secretion system